MRYAWTRKGIDPSAVVSIVKGFFAEKGFIEAPGSRIRKKWHEMTFETSQEGKFRSVKVKVVGLPEGFEIDLSYDTAYASARMGVLPTFLGGGIIMKRKLEHADPHFYERLEYDLVDFVERRIGDGR